MYKDTGKYPNPCSNIIKLYHQEFIKVLGTFRMKMGLQAKRNWLKWRCTLYGRLCARATCTGIRGLAPNIANDPRITNIPAHIRNVH